LFFLKQIVCSHPGLVVKGSIFRSNNRCQHPLDTTSS